jgi:hypothetical protein
MRIRHWVQFAIAVALLTVGERGRACEDDHPPIVITPAKKFLLRDGAKQNVLKIVFDPRGVSSVIPQGDEGARWIDSDNPTGVWHYREWQWWKGHPYGESCRPRFWTEAHFRPRHEPPGATISYHIDGFDCRQVFLLPDQVTNEAVSWDLITTVRNTSDRDVEEYGQFFACYTPLNRGRSFWYWDASDQLVRFADRGVTHLDGYIAHPQAYFFADGAIPHCPRGGGKVVGRWRSPIMVSQASPAGWRSIIMLDEEHAASLAQGIGGEAMDYILFPGPEQRTFTAGKEFSAHIRHLMLKSPELPNVERLRDLWNEFQQSHDAIRERAARL